MEGSYSIKKVLPVLCPELSYKELPIGDGVAAMGAFEKMYTMTDEKEIFNIRENLLTYCELDTYAMVRILEELEKICLI